MNREPLKIWEGVAAPMLRPNIDTDAIIPSREMKRVSKSGLDEGLFAGERYLDGGGRKPDPAFVLNRSDYQGCSILLGGPNFGCGSSREHAVWALREFGFRVIIASGFGSIFANNCVRNGLLPVTLSGQQVDALAEWVNESPQRHRLVINLEQLNIRAGDSTYDFVLDHGARHMLLNGLDAIALTLERKAVIYAFEAARQQQYPWLYQGGTAVSTGKAVQSD